MFISNITFVRHCCDCEPWACSPAVPMGQCRLCSVLEDMRLEALELELDETWAALSLEDKRRLVELLFE